MDKEEENLSLLEAPPKPLRHPFAPKALILLAAFLSFVLSVSLYFSGNETDGIFVGLWVPSILALGNMLTRSGIDQ